MFFLIILTIYTHFKTSRSSILDWDKFTICHVGEFLIFDFSAVCVRGFLFIYFFRFEAAGYDSKKAF